MKVVLSLATAALVLTVLVWVYVHYFMSRSLIAELETHPRGERAGETLLLTLPDGRRLPVNYLLEGSRVFIGADGPWWRQFRGDGGRAILLIRGQQRSGVGRAILDDPAYVAEVFARLRPDVPAWLPDWLNGTLVVVDLDA